MSNYTCRILINWLFYASLLLLSCNRGATTQNATPATTEYEQFLTQAHDRGQFNGNVLIIENGKEVYRGAFGIRNIAPIDLLTTNSVFRLGSVSKQFTAMGIMLLKESGQLDYDQDVRDFIPELPYQGIQIRHLLHHTSGLPDYLRMMSEHWKPDLEDYDPAKSISGNEDAIALLAAHKPAVHFLPGEQWEYSNTGYMLLASIVARTSGMPFEKYLHEQIFDKAGMSNTVVYDYRPEPDPEMPERVYGYMVGLDGKELISRDPHFLNGAQGDGGIYSTLDDLLKWDRMLYTDQLISEGALAEAFTPAVLNNGDTTDYGFGWFIDESYSGKKVVAHSGGWAGFTTYIHREIEDNHCIIILTNNTAQHFGGIQAGLLNMLHDRPYELPKRSIFAAMGKAVLAKGVDHAISHYQTLKTMAAHDYIFNEHELNNLGYQLMWAGHLKEAVGIFKLNLDEYPTSSNVYDSYGDGLLAKGDTVNALINFRKVAEMDPEFAGIHEKIRGLEVE